MNVGRLWRTARHLTPAQWRYRLTGQGRRIITRLAPDIARGRIEARAAALPLPDPSRPAVIDAAQHVLLLQRAAHPDDIARGRFTLLNRSFDFGAPETVRWRGEFHEGDNPLRRMTLAYMGYAVPLLARGRAEDAKTVASLVASLEAQNQWSSRGVLRDVWNPYTASHRLINLIAGLALYRASGAVPPPEAERALLDHARLCAAFVCENLERDLQYNHLMKNHVALALYAAACSAVPPTLSWIEHGVPATIAQNILPDGGHAERSPMYHALALLDVRVLRATELYPAWQTLLSETETRMRRALSVMAHPDGDIALFNDAWLGEAPSAADLDAQRADGPTARLPDTGYVRLSAARDAVIFDCGPIGPDDNPAHAHADFLSIEASAHGKRLIVDPGVPTYTAGELRNIARAAISHNGPQLDGIEPMEFWKSFRVGRRGVAYEIRDERLAGLAPLWCAGRHTGYAHLGVEVRRYVGLWPGFALLVADLWRGPVRAPEASRFLIPGTWRPRRDGAPGFTLEDTSVTIECLHGTPAPVEASRIWPRFDVQQPAHRIAVRPVAAQDGTRRAALFFRWNDDAASPSLAALRDQLDKLAAA
jgi:uncharacterized heparinase superfamily protein